MQSDTRSSGVMWGYVGIRVGRQEVDRLRDR